MITTNDEHFQTCGRSARANACTLRELHVNSIFFALVSQLHGLATFALAINCVCADLSVYSSKFVVEILRGRFQLAPGQCMTSGRMSSVNAEGVLVPPSRLTKLQRSTFNSLPVTSQRFRPTSHLLVEQATFPDVSRTDFHRESVSHRWSLILPAVDALFGSRSNTLQPEYLRPCITRAQ